MKKVVAGLVIIIIIGAGAYLTLKGKGAAPSESAQTTMDAPSSKSLSALVAAGMPVTCTFATTTLAGAVQGTMYVAGGMVAGDFTTQTPRVGAVDAHMIVRDNTAYVWTSMSTTGFKSAVSASSTPTDKGVDYNAQMDYSCQPWVADNSKFTLPTTITFTSTASYTAPSTGTGATGSAAASYKGTAAQCAQCASFPASSKAQCEAALHC